MNIQAAFASGPFWAVAAALASFSWGCDDDLSDTVDRTLTSTVTVGSRPTLVVDSVVPVSVVGERRFNEVLVVFEATMTASSAERAEQILDGYNIQSDGESRPGATIITVAAADDGLLGGNLEVRAPLDLALEIAARSGRAEVEAMEDDITVQSSGDVLILGAEADVLVRASAGSVRLDTSLRVGNRVDISTGRGDVQVELPLLLDANIDADATGSVVVQHRELPRPVGLSYRTTAGRGLASVVVTTLQGSVLFSERGGN